MYEFDDTRQRCYEGTRLLGKGSRRITEDIFENLFPLRYTFGLIQNKIKGLLFIL